MAGVLALIALITGLVLRALDWISPFSFDVLFTLFVSQSVCAMLPRLGAPRRTAVLVSWSLAFGVMSAAWLWPSIRLAPYLAILLTNGFIAAVFARSLVAGREPLILQMIRIAQSGPKGNADFQAYVYWQSWSWVALGAGTALAGLFGMIWAGARDGLDWMIAGLLIFQILWFVATHGYARARHDRKETSLDTLRLMSNPRLWSELEI